MEVELYTENNMYKNFKIIGNILYQGDIINEVYCVVDEVQPDFLTQKANYSVNYYSSKEKFELNKNFQIILDKLANAFIKPFGIQFTSNEDIYTKIFNEMKEYYEKLGYFVE